MAQFPQRMIALWSGLPRGRRLLLAGAGGLLLVTLYFMYSWSSSVSYAPLYSGLDTTDSAAIVEELRTRGVSYRLSGGGATIEVPEPQVDELRLDFAAQGLPQGGATGFELFNGNSFTATDFVQRLNFQRGLQGELERTIETFGAVEHARVHIVLPEQSLFIRDERPATASVVLSLKAGQRLAPNEVEGIARLIAGAVEGLDQQQVSIIDTSGSVIYDGRTAAQPDGLVAQPGSVLELQHQYEQTLQLSVQQVLDRTLGAGQSAVTVRAQLNMDRVETQTEAYTPGETDTGVPRSSTSVTESYDANGAAAGGVVPGAVANVPGADTSLAENATGGSDGGTTYARNETTTNFEVGRTVTTTVQAPGSVERLSVSLMLDETIPAEQVESLQQAVAAAAGIDSERGDTIAVTRVAFDRTLADEAEAAFQAEAQSQQLFSYVRLALPVLALIAGFVFFKLLTRSVNQRGYRVLTPEGVASGSGRLLPGDAYEALDGPMRTRALPAPKDNRSEVEQAVSGFAIQRPTAVASVVQSWLKDE